VTVGQTQVASGALGRCTTCTAVEHSHLRHHPVCTLHTWIRSNLSLRRCSSKGQSAVRRPIRTHLLPSCCRLRRREGGRCVCVYHVARLFCFRSLFYHLCLVVSLTLLPRPQQLHRVGVPFSVDAFTRWAASAWTMRCQCAGDDAVSFV
jgi:hypothetical protein